MKALNRMAADFAETHPEGVARIAEGHSVEAIVEFFGTLPLEISARVLGKLIPGIAAQVLALLSPSIAGELLQLIPFANGVGALRHCDSVIREKILSATPEEFSKRIAAFLHFPEQTAAGLADSTIFAIPDDVSVAEAIALCQKNPKEAHHYLYVVDRDQELRGVISLMELISSEPTALLEHVMTKEVSYLGGGEKRTDVLLHAGWRQYHALPVVDEEHRFLGAIRYETLRLLESNVEEVDSGKAASEAVRAFGSLYGLALMGLAQGVTQVMQPTSKKKGPK